MRLPSLRLALTLVGVTVLSASAPVNGALASPLCGLNSIYCWYESGTITSTDSVASCTDVYGTVVVCNASYDLTRGAFVATYQTTGGAGGGSVAVTAVDQYRVEGVSPGTPLVFAAELDLGLSVFGYDCKPRGFYLPVSASTTLREGDSNQSSASITTPVTCGPQLCCAQAKSLRTTLQVVITQTAGDRFTLHFDLRSEGYGSGQISGQLRFSGLPPGAFVVSCQGYGNDLVTAAKKLSWGGLKVFYR